MPNFIGPSLTRSGATIWHASNDGSGSSLDADLLDGVNGASYARIDSANTWTVGDHYINYAMAATGTAGTAALRIGPRGSLTTSSTATILGDNVFWNGSSWITYNTATSSLFSITGTEMVYSTAPSVTAGTAASMVQRFVVNNAGQLTVQSLVLGAALPAIYGGTGQTVYAVGDILYASTTTALSKLAGVATGNALISGGVGAAPTWGKIALTTHVSGTLPIANGGTNSTATATNGGVGYGTGTAHAYTAAGTSTQILRSNGAAAPTWVTLDMSYLPDAAFKKSVRVATTANITLSGTQTIDGIAVVAADRVLVKNQTTVSQNGIYAVAAGAWTRVTDGDTAAEIAGATVNIDAGTQGGQLWSNTFKSTDTLGTTAMNWYRIFDTSQVIPIANGGTGSATQNFVDLSSTQGGIAGAKTFSGGLTSNSSFTATSSTTNAASIQTASASQTPLFVKGFTSQTADLQQWADSLNTVLAKVNFNGYATFQGATIMTDSSAGIPEAFALSNAGGGNVYFRVASNTGGGLQLVNTDFSAVPFQFKNNGTMLLEKGTVSEPGIAFNGDTNTGIYSASGGNVAIATAGNIAALLDHNNSYIYSPLQVTLLKPSGVTGATTATRYVGGTATGAPTTGTHSVGDWIIAQNGALWVCTTGGSPGTWTQAGGGGSFVDLTTNQTIAGDKTFNGWTTLSGMDSIHTESSTSSYYANEFRYNVQNASASGNDKFAVYVWANKNAGVGSISELGAGYFSGTVTTAATVSDLYGIKADVQIYTGNGSATRAYSMYVTAPTESGTGSIGTGYGIYVQTSTQSTTNYGIYLSDMGAGTTSRYALYVAGTTSWSKIDGKLFVNNLETTGNSDVVVDDAMYWMTVGV